MKTQLMMVLAALAAACSGVPEFTPPAKAPERPDPAAQAENDRLSRKDKVAGRIGAAFDSDDKGDAAVKLRVDVLVKCVEAAAKGEVPKSRCACLQQAIENGEDPYQTCQAAGAEASPGPSPAQTGEEHPALTMAPETPPLQAAPMWVGVVGTVPPPGWDSSIGMRFEPTRLPRQMDQAGMMRPVCDLEMAYGGHLVAWTMGGSPVPVPLLIPVPDGAGMPVARDGATVAGNMTSVLPRGMAGYVFFDRMIVGGRLVPVPMDTLGKERNLRCWRSSVAVVNPGGAPALSRTTVLEGQSVGGTFSPGADPKRIPFTWFQRHLPAPTTPLWIPAPA